MSLPSRALDVANLQKIWNARIERAREMERVHPAAAETLRFYAAILQFQKQVAADAPATLDRERGLNKQVDLRFAAKKVRALLELVVQKGPKALILDARQAQGRTQHQWEELFRSALSEKVPFPNFSDSFYTRACLQPIAENLQSRINSDTLPPKNRCAACGGLPQFSILRPEGEGASRWLQCSMCLREWPYRRLICLYCGEEDREKLPRYSADDFVHVYVEACDSCHRYLKVVDLSVDGHAIALVDEAAAVALDVWATNQGYEKIIRNLIGF